MTRMGFPGGCPGISPSLSGRGRYAAPRRRSIRGYRDEPVPRELIEEVLALAMRSPTSMNTQP